MMLTPDSQDTVIGFTLLLGELLANVTVSANDTCSVCQSALFELASADTERLLKLRRRGRSHRVVELLKRRLFVSFASVCVADSFLLVFSCRVKEAACW